MQKKYKSVGINALLNAIRTGLSILFPLITYPYAFRILHAENIGKVNFASSIVSYFSLIAALGFSSYSVREGAKIREDSDKINKFASQIFSLNIMSTLVAYLILLICIVTVPKFHGYMLLIVICSITIVFKTLSMDWINTIYEDYVFITIRTIIAQLIIFILLFSLVHIE